MLEELLAKDEGKILEFKENTQSLQKIVQTVPLLIQLVAP